MIGYVICGSFCNFENSIKVLEETAEKFGDVVPIMSYNAYNTDTRFGKAAGFIEKIENICKRKIVHTLEDAEPLGPKIKLDLMIICPCTGNTLSKLANGIYDTPATLAAKAHMRNGRPLLISLATNDALSGNIENVSKLYVRKNVFFVPMHEDDVKSKPASLVCDFSLVVKASDLALSGKQMLPLFI